ncbi:MAG TPA: pyridoxal phosphate-dependent aminotransferase [Longimicrobiales bacterium]|nr:pyridoxal phosphate-dependent aminotransferase [Longimicrobiales bacterium]
MKPSENMRGIAPSATLSVAARARELRALGRDVLDLSAGEPDLPTPEFVRRAGMAAIERGLTRYTHVAGLPELRQAIARELWRRTGADVDPAGVVVSAGAKQALFNACFVLFGPGDRVLVPSPYWTSYPDIVRLARAEPVFVPGDPARGFKVGPAELGAAFDGRVRGLILNSPSNPTGAVYGLDELEAVVGWAAEHGVVVLSDEIYGQLCFTGRRAPSVLDLEPEPRARIVLIDGASKAFAMTGWRIGFSASSPALGVEIQALQSHITSNAATPAQYAALAAFSASAEERQAFEAMARTFHARRDLLLRLFAAELPGLELVRPDGAFYVFFRVPGGAGSVAFCERMLEEAGVALVPGAAFGEDGYARLSFAAAEAVLVEGVRRLGEALRAAAAAY